MRDINQERERYKELEIKKPPVRYMTVNLSTCSLNKTGDCVDFTIDDRVSDNVSKMSV